MRSKNEQIIGFIDRLTNEIRLARELHLPLTAQILEIAKLDLRTKLHAISDRELRSFTRTLIESISLKGETLSSVTPPPKQ